MFEIKNLSFRYPGKRDANGEPDEGLHGIMIEEFHLERTGITAVIGPSGSGKTTFLSVLSGFLTPEIHTDGYFRFDGQDIAAGGFEPGQIAYVFQSAVLLGAASGTINALQGFVSAHRDGRAELPLQEAARLLRDLGLTKSQGKLMSRRAKHLSGGEAQRFAIARALMTDSNLILCDEPTSNIDENNAKQVLEAFKHWSLTKKRPVVWVTHNLEQAAEFADHFVFMSGGRIKQITEKEQNRLRERGKENRLAALRAINHRLREQSVADSPPQTAPPTGARQNPNSPVGSERFPISRLRYLWWIALSLATDGRYSDTRESAHPGILTPGSVRRLITRLAGESSSSDSADSRRPGAFWLRRAMAFLLGYSRHGLTGVLLIMLAQIFAAGVLGSFTNAYYEQKLQDPSVARIVFEHDVDAENRGSSSGKARNLYTDEITRMTSDMRAAFDGHASKEQLARVAVFGRRTEMTTQIRFPDLKPGCRAWLSKDSAVLSPNDPWLRQTVPEPDQIGKFPSGAALFDAIRAHYASEPDRGLILLGPVLASKLEKGCGVDLTKPLRAELAFSEIARSTPLEMDIIAVAHDMPPLHPSFPRIVLFENDYQRAAQMPNGSPPEAFRIAAAYFPIEGFDLAKRVIEDRFYVIRGNSEAAVKALRQIAALAVWVPLSVILINLGATTIVIVMVLGSILEINKRVLTLFRACGFTMRDIATVMLMVTAPAVLIAIAVLAALVMAAWPSIMLRFPADISGLTQLHTRWLLVVSALAILGSSIATIFVVSVWWKRAGEELASFLKE